MRTTSKHNCPRPDCTKVISNALFACRSDWFRLSAPVRAVIYATARLNLLDPKRRGAILAAMEEWKDDAIGS
jgi:hypothetical protein